METADVRLHASVRAYEKVKLALLLFTIFLNLWVGAGLLYGQSLQQDALKKNDQALSILQCAVDRNTQFTPQGRPRTPLDARIVFDQCVAAASRHK